MWNPGRPSAMFASTSTRTPSRPNTVPERALASTSADITLVCLSALASTHALAALQLAQRHQALDQEVKDQHPNDNSLVAAGGDGQDSIDRVQSGGDPKRQQRPAHGQISEDDQDRAFDSEHLWQELDPTQRDDETEQDRQTADDVEGDVGVPVASPKF